MKIILAQGNPGSQYHQTRHNIGWIVLDAIADSLGIQFRTNAKFSASIAEAVIDGEKLLLVKPTTFYNETGRTARAVTDFYKLTPATDVLVIHDDLALPFGAIRVREKGSDAGNNGIKSLNAHLGQSYWRIRIGIWSELRDRQPDVDFVLGTLSHDEVTYSTDYLVPAVNRLIEAFATDHLVPTSQPSTYQK